MDIPLSPPGKADFEERPATDCERWSREWPSCSVCAAQWMTRRGPTGCHITHVPFALLEPRPSRFKHQAQTPHRHLGAWLSPQSSVWPCPAIRVVRSGRAGETRAICMTVFFCSTVTVYVSQTLRGRDWRPRPHHPRCLLADAISSRPQSGRQAQPRSARLRLLLRQRERRPVGRFVAGTLA